MTTSESRRHRDQRLVMRERERQAKRDARQGYVPGGYVPSAHHLPPVRASYQRPGDRPHGPMRSTPPPNGYAYGPIPQYHSYPPAPAVPPRRKRLSTGGLIAIISLMVILGPSVIALVVFGVTSLIDGVVSLSASVSALIADIWIPAVTVLGVGGAGYLGYRAVRARKHKLALNGSLKKRLGKTKTKAKSASTDNTKALTASNPRELKPFDGEVSPGPMSEDERALMEMLEKNNGLRARELAEVQQQQSEGIDPFDGLSSAEREVEEQKLAIKQSEEATLRKLRAKKGSDSSSADGDAVGSGSNADAMYEQEMAELFAEFNMEDPTKTGSTVEYSFGGDVGSEDVPEPKPAESRKSKKRPGGIPKL